MPRLTHLLLLVLLAVSGCKGLQGCGASAPAPIAAVPDASTPSVAPPPPPPEARFAKSWLVIIHSSSTPGEGAGALEALKKTGLPAEPARVSTTAFRNLRPCLEVVVAKAFARRAEAEVFRERLGEAGLASYVKNAGPLDSDREGKEATCRAEAEAQAERVEALKRQAVPRFVESHAGRTFLLLGEGSESVALEPADARRSLWMAPVEEDPTGLFAKGDSVDIHGETGLVRAGCEVTGFAWINRGVPHFGYFQQEPPPEAPGCGQAWAFAELDCAVEPGEVLFALPASTKAPVFFTAGSGPSAEVLSGQETALRRSPDFTGLRSEGSVHAERMQEKLSEQVKAYSFSSGERHVVFTVARFLTGEGNAMCGPDYNQQVTRAVLWGPGGEERLLPVKELDGEEVLGVMDLEGDGRVELLLHGRGVRLIREDGTEVAGAVVENCDCAC